MGFLAKLFGVACGYSAADISRWQSMFPDGVSRMDLRTFEVVHKVPVLDAIRHVQNSHGGDANSGSYAIVGSIEKGDAVPTACGRFAYFDVVARQRKKAQGA